MSVRSLLLALVIAFTLSCSTSCVFSRSVKELFAESGPAVFLLETDDGNGHCSSFHIGNGIVLTAAHCISEKSEILHLGENETVRDPRVLLVDAQSDIAVLHVPEAGISEFAVLGEVPPIGERLVTIGFPGYFESKTIDIGYVIGLGNLDGVPVIFGSGNAFPGESGGPVLDEHGFVVGIVSKISLRGIVYPTGHHIHRDVAVFMSVDVIKKQVDRALTER